MPTIYNYGAEMVTSPTDYDHASWNKTNTTISSDTILDSSVSTNVEHNINQTIASGTSGQKYRLYVWANASEVNWIRVQWSSPLDTAYYTRWVNLTTGALGDGSLLLNVTVHSERIYDMLNGGYAIEAILSRTVDPTSSVVKVVYGDADADTTRTLAVNDSVQVHTVSLKPTAVPTVSVAPVAVLSGGTLALAYCSPGTWNGPESHAYQWYRFSDGAGSGATSIGGATKPYRTIAAADRGKWLACDVTPTNDAGAGTTSRSNLVMVPGGVVALLLAGVG